MKLLQLFLSPLSDVTRAVVMPFRALCVVGLTGSINAMTYHGVWWLKWVALGLGVAVLVSFVKAARALLFLALVACVGRTLYRRYGREARKRFEDWVGTAQPQTAQVLAVLHAPPRPVTARNDTDRPA